VSDFRFRALISVVFQPLCPACSLFLFRRINDDDDDDDDDLSRSIILDIEVLTLS